MFAVGLCIDTAYLLISLAEATPDRASTAIGMLTPALSRADVAMMVAIVPFLGFQLWCSRRSANGARKNCYDGRCHGVAKIPPVPSRVTGTSASTANMS